ncbi:MAG TPA: carbohydrate-binding protein [Vicinamibacterales bacterium]|nr:carbohydrate-binding protein [Vicinamibacterales bacterium]
MTSRTIVPRPRNIALGVAAALVLVRGGTPVATVSAQGTAVHAWVTTTDQSRLLAPVMDSAFGSSAATGQFLVSVDDSQQFQRITGFGASMTESSAWLLATQVPAARRAEVMTRLFSTDTGIGLSFVRQPIGASDFSLSHYSYDDVPYGETDYSLARFSAAHDDAYVFPALRDALRLNPQLTVMASPWSAPAWMKTSGSMVGGMLAPSAYGAFASYLVKSVQAIEARGIPVAAITIQNEPRYLPADYPGMYMPAEDQAMLIRQHVGPAFAASGLRAQLLAWDQNWEADYPFAVMQDPAAARYLSGVAYHCYAGDPAEMTYLHDSFPSASALVTECSTGAWSQTPFSTALYEKLRVLIRSTRNWAQAVATWNLVLDSTGGPHTGGCTTCSPLVTVDRASGAVRYEADYFALGHFSGFVKPGARRVASTSFESQGVETVAFVNPDGTHVLVVWNGWGTRRITVAWQGTAFAYDVPGEAVMTFTWGGTLPVTPPPSDVPPPASNGFVVPGTIEAEDFTAYADTTPGNSGGAYRSTDVDIEATSDAGGGFNVGWISTGESLSYAVSVSSSATYEAAVRVAANGPGGQFHLDVDGTRWGASLSIPNTGGWQNWSTVTAAAPMAAGAHTFRIVFDAPGSTGIVGNLNWIALTAIGTPSTTPFSGTGVALPQRIQAEAFDTGAEGSAYHDIDAPNQGGQYRSTGVDLEQTSDAGGGYNVGWMAPGEWLAYSTTVAVGATYRLDVRVASIVAGATYHLEVDGSNATGALTMPNTGGWQNWTTVSAPLTLAAGAHTLRLVVDTAGPSAMVGNVNWIEVVAVPH